jgi:hypothetical protein
LTIGKAKWNGSERAQKSDRTSRFGFAWPDSEQSMDPGNLLVWLLSASSAIQAIGAAVTVGPWQFRQPHPSDFNVGLSTNTGLQIDRSSETMEFFRAVKVDEIPQYVLIQRRCQKSCLPFNPLT